MGLLHVLILRGPYHTEPTCLQRSFGQCIIPRICVRVTYVLNLSILDLSASLYVRSLIRVVYKKDPVITSVSSLIITIFHFQISEAESKASRASGGGGDPARGTVDNRFRVSLG